MPRGLYTESTVATSKNRSAPLAWPTDSPDMSANAFSDRRYSSKTMQANTLIRNFTSTHQYRNKPHSVTRDETSPVNSETKANGTMTHQTINSIAGWAARTVALSRLPRLAMASARKPTTAPSQPTEMMTC